jgi:putative membrane protein
VKVSSAVQPSSSHARRFVTGLAVGLSPILLLSLATWAFWHPDSRLDEVAAAIVNEDDPVVSDGQYLPLGRQLAAELVAGAGDYDPTYRWVMTTADDARRGLDSGAYTVAVTIPAGFSKAATSLSGPPLDAREATIEVVSGARSTLVDDTLSRAVVEAAARSLGRQVSEAYLANVYLGFSTLHDRLGEAAEGAGALADGTGQAAAGTVQLADGTDTAAAGAFQVADGAAQLAAGAAELSRGNALLADNLETLAGQAPAFEDGLGRLSAGLRQLADAVAFIREVAGPVGQGSTAVSDWARRLREDPAAQAEFFAQLRSSCRQAGLQAAFCDNLRSTLEAALANPDVALALSQFLTVVEFTADQANGLAGSGQTLADGLDESAAGAALLFDKSKDLVDGSGQLAKGARQAADGSSALAAAAGELAAGAGLVSGGLEQIHSSLLTLADAAARLDAGASELATGLGDAAGQTPSYSAAEQDRLKRTVTEPVEAQAAALKISGLLSLYAAFALWLGSVATFLLVRPLPHDTLGSRRSALRSVGKALLPALGLAAAQGVLVGVAVALASGAAPGRAAAAVAACVGLAFSFAAVNQGLAALLGGSLSRLAAMAAAAVAGLAAVAANLPSVLRQVADVLPTNPAAGLVHAVLGGPGSVGGAVFALALWGILGLAASAAAAGRTRSLSSRRLWSRLAVKAWPRGPALAAGSGRT